jgi:CheY-like chemotaxis protein
MASTQVNSTCRPLRILIVDDNHINLSILSTLLKRRFNHLIEGAPVSVDSGLKAIQLLRTHIFDCIFMDIQMPFLSGLEASRRIRNAQDGILPANGEAHIVAVTTAIGDEPELAYRRSRMDGMIGKPVRYQQLQQYLVPLAMEAHKAGLTVPPLNIDGQLVMPPLPPASEYERVFYVPADAVTPSSRPDICEGSDFERLLHSQTRASLHRFDMMTPDSNPALPLITHDLDSTLVEEDCFQSRTPSEASRSNSSSQLEKMQQSIPPRTLPKVSPSKHSRTGSMIISQRTLSKQILREVANANLDGEASDMATVVRSATSSPLRILPVRPRVLQRNSSPGWLSDDPNLGESPAIAQSPAVKLKRPSLSTLAWRETGQSSTSSGSCSELSEDSLVYSTHRRVSEASSSTSSDNSSAVTTPACDSPLTFWATGTGQMSGFGKEHERTYSNRTASAADGDDCSVKVSASWSASSDTATAASSPARVNKTTTSRGEGQSSPFNSATRRVVRHIDSLQELSQRIRQMELPP